MQVLRILSHLRSARLSIELLRGTAIAQTLKPPDGRLGQSVGFIHDKMVWWKPFFVCNLNHNLAAIKLQRGSPRLPHQALYELDSAQR